MIWNDSKVEPISWEIGKKLRFNFCVGVWVGEHPLAYFWHVSKDAQADYTPFDINIVLVGDYANMILDANRQKIWWVKIPWG